MAKFKICRSFGYSGTRSCMTIEAETLEEAQDEAWEYALEKVESWAELIEGTKDD